MVVAGARGHAGRRRRARAPIRASSCAREAIAELAAAAREAGRMAITVELDPERAERARMVAVVVAVPGQAPAYIPLGHRYIGAPAPPPAARSRAAPRGARGSDGREDRARREDGRCARSLDRRRRGRGHHRGHDARRVPARSDGGGRARRGGRAAARRRDAAGARDDRRHGASTASRADRGRARGAVGRRDHARAAADRRAAAARLAAGGLDDALSRHRAAGRAAARRHRARRHPHRHRALQAACRPRSTRRARPRSSAQIYELAGERVQHRLAQAARRAAVRQARPRHQGCAPHQDRLVDRGRHARAARAPDHQADPRAPRDHQAQGHIPRRAAAAGQPADRPHPHDVQPGRRRDRAASRRRIRTSRTSRSARELGMQIRARLHRARRATC